MNVLQAIQYIIQGWNEVTSDTIKNCWNHIKLLSADTIPRYLYEDDNLTIDDELNKVIKALHLPNMMQIKEFLTIPEKDIIYEIPNISEFADMFNNKHTDHPDEIDDSDEVICNNEILRNLRIVNLFLLQQENASKQIKLVDKIEKFIKKEKFNSMQQTTIDQYFR